MTNDSPNSMFKDFDEYFDAVLSHYGNPGSKVDLICEDTGLTKQAVIDALKKRNIPVKDNISIPVKNETRCSMHALIVGKIEGNKFKVYHMVVYEAEPTQLDIDSLRQELTTDKEFGLTDIIDSLEIQATTILKPFGY